MARKIVLLVEAEHPQGLSARKLIVESLRHHVYTAHNGAQALSLLARIHPDVVLVHSQIEGQSCEDIIGDIRQHHPHLKVVALTPGETSLCGEVVTLNSLHPQDLVRFFEASVDPQPA